MLAPSVGAAFLPAAVEIPPDRARFTIDGDHELEAQLAQTCARVVSGLRGIIPAASLQAVLLGGGYGRGEGGVLRAPGERDRPYNDVEFYVAVRGNRHANEWRYRAPLAALAHILTRLSDVEVEFKITSLEEIAAAPPSMYMYDLAAGNRRVAGDLKRVQRSLSPHRRWDQIPVDEAIRLLFNRCSGLLLARLELESKAFDAGAADFVGRNLAKAQLAVGDAVLTSMRCYHWSCRERNRRLARQAGTGVPELPAVKRHHNAGVAFKLYPRVTAASREELLAAHTDLSALALRVWLWIESRRLGRSYASARAYASDAVNFFPESSSARNCLLNLRASGAAYCLNQHRRRWRHPRERAMRALVLLLWEPDALTSPALLQRLQDELDTTATSFPDLVAAYRSLWERVQ